jgi:hypothetical protein
MSRTFHHGDRRIRVRGMRRDEPDLRKLARALINLAQAQAEADAQTEHADVLSRERTPRGRTPGGKPRRRTRR